MKLITRSKGTITVNEIKAINSSECELEIFPYSDDMKHSSKDSILINADLLDGYRTHDDYFDDLVALYDLDCSSLYQAVNNIINGKADVFVDDILIFSFNDKAKG